ncbi:hypothetical protein [Rhodosalinus sp. FB01]|uniref:hypothetical protein n=1 Tax=Rhodosalinus sp. FB01 TaxID=3239194 RepID=UPI0035255882
MDSTINSAFAGGVGAPPLGGVEQRIAPFVPFQIRGDGGEHQHRVEIAAEERAELREQPHEGRDVLGVKRVEPFLDPVARDLRWQHARPRPWSEWALSDAG